jgi:hypothetical protein
VFVVTESGRLPHGALTGHFRLAVSRPNQARSCLSPNSPIKLPSNNRPKKGRVGTGVGGTGVGGAMPVRVIGSDGLAFVLRFEHKSGDTADMVVHTPTPIKSSRCPYRICGH